MHRFFVSSSNIHNGHFSSRDSELCHQFRQVLKFREGDQVVLLDNSGREFLVEMKSVSKEVCEGEVISSELKEDVSDRRAVHLYVALLKNQNRWEWVLEKGTELGVASFTPLITDRTEVDCLRKVDRCERIVKEAAEQSGRVRLPVVEIPVEIGDLFKAQGSKFKEIMNGSQFLIATLSGNGVFICDFGNLGNDVSILIGPEGGFTDEEVKFAVEHLKAQPVSLGSQVLRTETAAIVSAEMVIGG